MRKILIIVWLFVPLAAMAYHYGPGQNLMKLDEISGILKEAQAYASQGEWVLAIEKYEQALSKLPPERIGQSRRIRLARSAALINSGHLLEANSELETLMDELVSDKSGDTKDNSALLYETRSALANSQYYMTWLLRLEGSPEDEWRHYSDAARQNYRVLAEDAAKKGDRSVAKQMKEDIESSIRLARMDLNELQALPLAPQCKLCRGCETGS